MPWIHAPATTRRTPRHDVDVPCELVTQYSDDPIMMWATDMSAHGLWLETRRFFELGEELVVCFRPGVRWKAHELMVFANVARLSPGARKEDDCAGVGLSFLDLSGNERWALRSWLRPRPEKIASRRRSAGTTSISRAAVTPLARFGRSPFSERVC